MTLLRLKKITLDKKIQPRVALSQDTINEYYEAHINGDEFPNIVVFEDKKGKFYLADGWHRLKAAEKAKITEMESDVIAGSFRDALKYSLSANAKHGLNRSQSDRRLAVETCMNDPEWCQRTARGIAKLCGVSHHLVNTIYKEKADAVALRAKQLAKAEAANKSGINSTSENKDDDKQADNKTADTKSGFDTSTKTKPKDKPKADKYEPPEGMELVEKHSYQELLVNYKETLDENAALHKMIESNEPMKVAAAELNKVSSKLKILESRMHGLMSEKNEALKMVKAHKAVIDKLNKQVKGFGATEEF